MDKVIRRVDKIASKKQEEIIQLSLDIAHRWVIIIRWGINKVSGGVRSKAFAFRTPISIGRS